MKLGIQESLDLAKDIQKNFKNFQGAEVVICPGFLPLVKIKETLKNSSIKLGAQNIFWDSRGAYTGEVSYEDLEEAGCAYVILGHSERRQYLQENYAMIHKKIKIAIQKSKLAPIVCIGETKEEKKSGKRDFVLSDQLQIALSGLNIAKNQQIIIAYEPLWAIGSGVSIKPENAEYAHKIIYLNIKDMFGFDIAKNNFKIIYGGSVTSQNSKSFLETPGVDGLLIGGASLNADEFYKIAKIA